MFKTTKSAQSFAKIANQANLIIFQQTPGWAGKEAPPLQQDSITVPLGHSIKLLRHIPDIITLKWLHKGLNKVILKKSFHCYSLLLSWEGISCVFLQGLGLALVLPSIFIIVKFGSETHLEGAVITHRSKDQNQIKITRSKSQDQNQRQSWRTYFRTFLQ